MTELVLRSRQRTRHVHSPLLRRVMRALLTDLLTLERYDLGIHLVASPEMARINQQFLDHAGSTDVITFDYAGETTPTPSHRLNARARKILSSGAEGGSAVESSTAAAKGHRSSPSPREARTGRGLGRGVSVLGQQPSSPRPSPPSVGGEGDVGSLRQRLDPPVVGTRVAFTRPPEHVHGEIFICIDDAVKQARQFRTTWQSELVRYLIHGVLHLVGYDDLTPDARRVMKREENRLLRRLARQFRLGRIYAGEKRDPDQTQRRREL